MAEWLALAQALFDAGGWTVAILLVVIALVGVWKGWWVLRPQYREKANEAADLRKVVDRMTAAELARARRSRKTDAS